MELKPAANKIMYCLLLRDLPLELKLSDSGNLKFFPLESGLKARRVRLHNCILPQSRKAPRAAICPAQYYNLRRCRVHIVDWWHRPFRWISSMRMTFVVSRFCDLLVVAILCLQNCIDLLIMFPGFEMIFVCIFYPSFVVKRSFICDYFLLFR